MNGLFGMPGIRSMDVQELDALKDVLQSGALYRGAGFSEPKYVLRAENSLRLLTERKHVLMMNSGTSALQASLRAVGVSSGDEVIVSSFGWITDVSSIIELGATPVFAPLLSGLLTDISQIPKLIGNRTKAILVIQPCGQTVDLTSLIAIAKTRGIAVIEDACQSLGASPKGHTKTDKPTISIFSFQSFKIITCGEGGAIATDNDDLYLKMVRYHDAGLDRFTVSIPSKDLKQPVGLGFNLRMSELHAAILDIQFKKLPLILERLKTTHARWTSEIKMLFKNSKVINSPENSPQNFSYLVIESRDEKDALELFETLNSTHAHCAYGQHDHLHLVHGWISFLERNGFPYRSEHLEQSLDIIKRTVMVQVNWQQEALFTDKIRKQKQI